MGSYLRPHGPGGAGHATVRVPRRGPGAGATSRRTLAGRLLWETESPGPATPRVTRGDRMDVGPTLAKGHPRSLDHGCNVRSTCRCSVYPAIHTTTRSLLRSSSTHEPSDPPLRVVLLVVRLHEGDAIIGLRLSNPRESPPIWGRRAAPTEWTFSAPVDGPVRPSGGAPWTRHGGRGQVSLAPSPPWFDRAAVSPASFDGDAG